MHDNNNLLNWISTKYLENNEIFLPEWTKMSFLMQLTAVSFKECLI